MQKLFCALLILLCGCATNIKTESLAKAAEASGMVRVEIHTDGFALTSYQHITAPDHAVRIYIEGDGLAWITRTQPSTDPTPRHAIGLALALADPSPNVVYLARPCQYSLAQSPRCEATYWTDRRFSEEVIQAMNNAMDIILHDASGQKAELIGYSGGGTMAVLLAARRNDVANLRTIAGNLDHATVNRMHGVADMPDSLNPIEVVSYITELPQTHFIGMKDQVISPSIARSFVRHVGRCAELVELPDATHEEGWISAWLHLLEDVPKCH